VKGHQDDFTSAETLDRWAKLNVEMDAKAKAHIVVAKRSPRHYMVTATLWSLWTNDKKIPTDLPSKIYDAVHSDEAKEYWMQENDISREVIEKIQWEHIAAAMTETKRNKRVFILKHLCGMCGVGKFMKHWKKRADSACPRCGKFEDAPHVWICHDQGADGIWDKALKELESWLKSVQTSPDLQYLILNHLQS
jgi:hypothetical protein